MMIPIRLRSTFSHTLYRKYFLSILFLLAITLSLSAQNIIQNGKSLYLSNTIIVKVKKGITLSQLNKTLAKFSINNAKELYNSKGTINKVPGQEILSGIYLVKYNTADNPEKLAAKIAEIPEILWAEPKYIRRVCYTPTDSLFLTGEQDNLLQIDAPKAWNITKGDKKIIIGIIDSGVDWKHPDLAENIYLENGSLIAGSDLGGLDGTPDDDPSEDIQPGMWYHGSFIAGIASAVTDNKIGVASIGFNCSILPVKVTRGNITLSGEPLVVSGFEGIKWAADHGAKIINCSWGGYGHSSYEQSIIDYAIAKGAIVVASYGNDSSNTDYYPASYDGVLSVGWLDTGVGVKTIDPGANYGKNVKVFAPGSRIYSTWQRTEQSSPGIYKVGRGSSASAPHVSGLAGLVWSVFPSYIPMQVLERIRVTSDYIDDYNKSSYRNLLGHGVINAYRAVDKNVKAISVRADSIHFVGTGNQEGIFGPEEEVSVYIDFTNYLAKVDNVTVTLTTDDNYTTIENSTFNTGPINTLATISNKSNVFKFKIDRNTPGNHTIYFLLKYSNGTDYNDFQWINLKTTLSYATISNNNIKLTVTSKGTLGFNDFPFNRAGEGFKYKESENLMFEGAFMYGTGPDNLMNEARIHDRQKKDFIWNAPLKTVFDPYSHAIFAYFSDEGASINPLGIRNALCCNYSPTFQDSNSVWLINTLYNETSEDIEQLYAGYFIDWNIPESDFGNDTTYYDLVNNVAIAYNTRNAALPYTAMGLISTINDLGGDRYILKNPFGFYAIDNNANSGPVQIGDTDGFTDAEKWYALSNGIKKQSAGRGDISYVISEGPYTILKGQEILVEFAISAGSTLQEAIDAIKTLRAKTGRNEELIPSEFQLDQNYPNPFNSTTMIRYQLAADRMVTLRVYDILGRTVVTLVNELQRPGEYKVQFSTSVNQLSSGVYFYTLTAGSYTTTKKMILLK